MGGTIFNNTGIILFLFFIVFCYEKSHSDVALQ